MHRTLIVARIRSGSESDVARIFAASDRTDLPDRAGVQCRELYALGDIYVHLLETREPPDVALAQARQSVEFQLISEQLEPYVSAYLPTWSSPRDAMATRFYRWVPDQDAHSSHRVVRM